MRRRRPGAAPIILASLIVSVGCGAPHSPPSGAELPHLTFVADFVLPFAGRETGLEFGGLSGLAFDPEAGVWIGVSDDQRSPRWFALHVGVTPAGLRVDLGPAVLADTAAQNPSVPSTLDFESVGLLPNGDLLIGSEGDFVNGVRHPHSIVRFTRSGRFVGEVPLPNHYRGDPEARSPRGLRDNLGFEGMAVSPDGTRVWLVAENPLLQDAEPPAIDAGARTRMLELVARGGSFAPGRELVYEIAPSGRPEMLGADARLVDQGVVALLWLAEGELLSLERAFLRDDAAGRGGNVVRVFHVRLDGADDVSGVASLGNMPQARAVTTTLLLDLADIAGELRPSLATLDNFEAMTWGPSLPDGTRTLLLAADDNFSTRQQNAFVLLAMRRGSGGE